MELIRKPKALGDRKISDTIKKGIVKRILDPSTCVVKILKIKPHKKYRKVIKKVKRIQAHISSSNYIECNDRFKSDFNVLVNSSYRNPFKCIVNSSNLLNKAVAVKSCKKISKKKNFIIDVVYKKANEILYNGKGKFIHKRIPYCLDYFNLYKKESENKRPMLPPSLLIDNYNLFKRLSNLIITKGIGNRNKYHRFLLSSYRKTSLDKISLGFLHKYYCKYIFRPHGIFTLENLLFYSRSQLIFVLACTPKCVTLINSLSLMRCSKIRIKPLPKSIYKELIKELDKCLILNQSGDFQNIHVQKSYKKSKLLNSYKILNVRGIFNIGLNNYLRSESTTLKNLQNSSVFDFFGVRPLPFVWCLQVLYRVPFSKFLVFPTNLYDYSVIDYVQIHRLSKAFRRVVKAEFKHSNRITSKLEISGQSFKIKFLKDLFKLYTDYSVSCLANLDKNFIKLINLTKIFFSLFKRLTYKQQIRLLRYLLKKDFKTLMFIHKIIVLTLLISNFIQLEPYYFNPSFSRLGVSLPNYRDILLKELPIKKDKFLKSFANKIVTLRK